MSELDEMTKRALCFELRLFGITRGHYSKQKRDVPTMELHRAQLQGMVYRQRTRAAAKASGALPCTHHAGEYQGDCPRCRGLWPWDRAKDLGSAEGQ